MPSIQALPTWLAWNNANFTSPTGLTDTATGQPFGAGGLNQGDYFDATNDEAANASFTTNGLLYAGRYRLVQVDSGATVANVKTGTVGYLRAGSSVKGVAILTAGSAQTAGTYQINATAGASGGSAAIISVVVGAAGTVTTPPVVIQGGVNYVGLPTFTMPAAAGGTPATFAVQLNATMNIVTSIDVANQYATLVRPVVFLNSITPGNYGFVQELGTATLIAGGTITPGQFVSTTGSGTGTVTSGTTYGILTVGQAIDAAVVTNTFKAILTSPEIQD